MANSYFQFKQFTIHQERSTLKVCTDSCILGAWTASRLQEAQCVLDIGAGTGLLTLMLAQKNQARFDAIELDEGAFEQAKENMAASPWPDRIQLIQGDARNFDFKSKYDFIITNPPFFESDLRSPSSVKNKAKHGATLGLEELLSVIYRTLNSSGAFSILLPFHRTDYFEKLAIEKGYFLQEKMLIRQSPAHLPFRSILLFTVRTVTTIAVHELIIRDDKGKETVELLSLLEDYYLRTL